MVPRIGKRKPRMYLIAAELDLAEYGKGLYRIGIVYSWSRPKVFVKLIKQKRKKK